MRLLLTALVLLTGCGEAPKATAPQKAEAPAPADESRRLPKAHQVSTKVVRSHLMEKQFMPGGTLADYKDGRREYQIFLAKMPSANEAALLLPDWRVALKDAKLVPSFGAYFGQDGERPVFVFIKNAWITGVVGLEQKDADSVARVLAAGLN